MLPHTAACFFDAVGCNEYSRSPCTVTKSLPSGCDMMKFVWAHALFLELVAKTSKSLQTEWVWKILCYMHVLFQNKKFVFLLLAFFSAYMLLVLTSEHSLQSMVFFFFFFLLNIRSNFACQKKSYTHTYTIL